VWAAATPQPDVLISADGRNVAVRGKDRRLHLMRTSRDAFLFKEWLAADADARAVGDPSLADGVSCDDAGCVVPNADGALVALSLRADALADDCLRAALVVSARQPPASCAASVIDRERVQRQGALVLREGRGGFLVDAVRPRGTDRPWSPAPGGGADTDTSFVPKSASPRGPDATPAEADLQADD
jgi:competence protein ComEC